MDMTTAGASALGGAAANPGKLLGKPEGHGGRSREELEAAWGGFRMKLHKDT